MHRPCESIGLRLPAGTGKTSLAQSPSVCSSREGRIAPTLSTKPLGQGHDLKDGQVPRGPAEELLAASLGDAHLGSHHGPGGPLRARLRRSGLCHGLHEALSFKGSVEVRARRQTVDEVLLHWMHVARYHCAAQAPFLFVGTKSDLAGEDILALGPVHIILSSW